MVSGLGTLGPYPHLSSSGSSVPMAPTQCSSADHDARLLVAEATISGTRFCDLPRRPGTDRPEHPTRIAVGLYFQRQAAGEIPVVAAQVVLEITGYPDRERCGSTPA